MTKEGRIRPTAVFWFAKKVLKLTLKSFQWGIDGSVCRRLQPSLLLLLLMLAGWPWRHCFLLPLIVLLTLQGSVQTFSDFLPLKINCSHYLLLWLYLVHCVFLCSMNTCVRTCFLLKIKKTSKARNWVWVIVWFFTVSHSIWSLGMLNKYFNWMYYSG